jgi:hypothetical protein
VSAFARATAVDSLGDGAWRATCEPSWNTQLGPNGELWSADGVLPAHSRQRALLVDGVR